MKSKAIWIGLGIQSVFWLIGCAVGQQPTFRYSPSVDQPHFDFALPDIQDGKLKKLSDFRGSKVLLLHFASW